MTSFVAEGGFRKDLNPIEAYEAIAGGPPDDGASDEGIYVVTSGDVSVDSGAP